MAGIEKIVNEILAEARAKADEILMEARDKAAKAEEDAISGSEAYKAKRAQEASAKADAIRVRAESQAMLEKRQAMLGIKQGIIDNVIEKAYETLAGQDDNAYFGMIGKLLGKAVRSGAGEICFSAADLKRLPEGFDDVIRGIAAEKGGELKISGEAAPIENGFLLKYGGIEENCSLRALFTSMRDRLQDKVNGALW